MPVLDVDPGTPLFRLNLVQYSDPAFFGRRMAYRFDAPDSSFGVCYLGTTLDCCFLEVLRPTRDPATGHPFLAKSELRDYYAAVVTVRQPFVLAHLADDGLAQAGIDQRVTGGDDYALSRAWAKAIHEHEGEVDGIFYPSRRHNTLYAVAVFERARHKVAFRRWGRLGDRRARSLWRETQRILARFRLGLLY